MSFPNYPNKYDLRGLIEPEDWLEYLKTQGQLPSIAPPAGAIICYQNSLWRHIGTLPGYEEVDGFLRDGRLFTRHGRAVLVVKSQGIGAPTAVSQLEELIAFGIRNFVSIGTAGALQDDIEIGDLVICDRAIRDEGTSHHYLPPRLDVAASAHIVGELKRSLEGFGLDARIGTSWTTDAPYRETIEEVQSYQKDGVAVVEMEAAALFAVAQYRKVELGALFTISDSLAGLKWNPAFHSSETRIGLKHIFDAAANSLARTAE